MWILSELRYAVRSLSRSPGFSAAFIVTLGLGIGANAAIFSVARSVFLRPLPNADESRLVFVRQSAEGVQADNVRFSVPEIEDYRAKSKTIASFGEFSTIGFTLIGLGEPRQVRAGVVDGRYFTVMGLKPALGRLIGPSDDGPNAPGVAVLTYRFWTSALTSDPEVLGKQVQLGARTATIIGVLEPAPPYPAETELIANVVTSPHHLGAAMKTDRRHRMTDLFGRLAPGVQLEAARGELRQIQSEMKSSAPEAYDESAGYGMEVVRMRDQMTLNARGTLGLLMATAGLVLAVSCANVANLLLARTIRRERELAVRAALGAGKGALRLVLLMECLVLALGGAAVGALVAAPAARALARYVARFTVRAVDAPVDAGILGFAAAASVLAAVLFALAPRLPEPGAGIGARGVGGVTSGGARQSQRALVIGQVALSFVLLVGAGLLLRTLLALQAVVPGFELDQVLAVSVPVVPGQAPAAIPARYTEISRRIRELPGVRAVAVGSATPLRDGGGPGGGLVLTAEGAVDDARVKPRATFRSVSPGYFETLGIPVLAGRDFTDDDRVDSGRVVIVSQSLVDRLYGGRVPIGGRMAWTDEVTQFIGISRDWRTIVGVVADVRENGLERPPDMIVYHPFAQETGGGRVFVRTEASPLLIAPAVQRVIRESAPNQPINVIGTLDDVRTEIIAPRRLNAILVTAFAMLALVIAVVGVSGVLACIVSSRMREYGIRMAIGSSPRGVMWRVLREGLVLAALGVVLGFGVAVGLSRLIAAALFGAGPTDPVAFVTAAAVLVLGALGAAAIPAVRAARADPAEVLRAE